MKRTIFLSQENVKQLLLLIFIFILYLLGKLNGNNENNTRNILIEVDIALENRTGSGPVNLQRGISKVLPYKTKNCQFIKMEYPPYERKKIIDYFYFSYPSMEESTFDQLKRYNRTKSLLLGPVFVPKKWFLFPIQNIWKERRFREILQSIKGVVVHSERVRDYLAMKSNNTDLLNKFIILRPCSYNMPKNVKPFENRKIDIILFEKYPDSNRSKQGEQLFNLLNSTKMKIERISYGGYNKKEIFNLANNSKFIIYFSFYDTGAIGLKEIQNYGVLTFSHQMDLVISNKTGFYIPELEFKDMKPAFLKIIKIIKNISKAHPNTKIISQINQERTDCKRSLDDLCNGIVFILLFISICWIKF